MKLSYYAAPRQKAVWGPKRILAAAAIMVVGLAPSAMAEGRQHARQGRKAEAGRPNSQVKAYKLDNELTFRAARGHATNKTKVIVELRPGATLPSKYQRYAKRHGQLGIINGLAVELPDRMLTELSMNPAVFRVHYDRPAAKFNYRTSLTVGTKVVRDTLGLTGAGVGVAVIDSGITTWHDDLTNNSTTVYPYGNQRVTAVRRLRQRADRALRRQRPRLARRRHHRGQRLRLERPEGRRGAGRQPGLAEGARRQRQRHGQQHHRGARLGAREPHHLQHPRRQHVGRRGDSRIGLDRPADARRQARRRRRRRRGRRGRQLRQEHGGPAAVRRHQRAGQRALGADRRRLEHEGHGEAHRRRGRQLQLARPDLHRLEREARPGRAGHRHGLARGRRAARSS